MKTINLTQDLIGALQTEYGGFTAATLKALGVAWPPLQGWRRKLIGSDITEAAYVAAMAGKDTLRPKTLKTRRKMARITPLLEKAYITHDRLNAAFDAAISRPES